jgi:hypothetical protein
MLVRSLIRASPKRREAAPLGTLEAARSASEVSAAPAQESNRHRELIPAPPRINVTIASGRELTCGIQAGFPARFLERQFTQPENSVPDNARPSCYDDQRNGDERHWPDALEKRRRGIGIGSHYNSLILRIAHGDNQRAAVSDAEFPVNFMQVHPHGAYSEAEVAGDGLAWGDRGWQPPSPVPRVA